MWGANLKHQKDERRGSSRRSLVFSQGFKEDGGSGPHWDGTYFSRVSMTLCIPLSQKCDEYILQIRKSSYTVQGHACGSRNEELGA